MKFKYNQIFWGTFFVLLGVLFLIDQINPLNLSFSHYKHYWPVFLIAIGLFYLNLPKFLKIIISGTSGLLFGLMVFSFFNNTWVKKEERSLYKSNESIIYNSSPSLFLKNDTLQKEYNLNIEFGAGEIKIKGQSNHLLEIFETNPSDLLFLEKYDSSKNNINITTQSDVNIGDKFLDREGKIKLNQDKIWSITADLGAVSADFDFSNYNIKELNVNSGASSIDIRLGEKYDSSEVNIDCGASKVEIYVPKNSGCKINQKTALSKNRFKDFIRLNEEEYETENYSTAKKKIILNLEGGVSKFEIKRY
jgi:hypothetical protein